MSFRLTNGQSGGTNAEARELVEKQRRKAAHAMRELSATMGGGPSEHDRKMVVQNVRRKYGREPKALLGASAVAPSSVKVRRTVPHLIL